MLILVIKEKKSNVYLNQSVHLTIDIIEWSKLLLRQTHPIYRFNILSPHKKLTTRKSFTANPLNLISFLKECRRRSHFVCTDFVIHTVVDGIFLFGCTKHFECNVVLLHLIIICFSKLNHNNCSQFRSTIDNDHIGHPFSALCY